VPLRLPAPERPDRERYQVPLPQRHIDELCPVGQRLSAGQRAGKQHVIGIGREPQHNPRRFWRRRGAIRSAASIGGRPLVAAQAFTAGFRRRLRLRRGSNRLGFLLGIVRRDPLLRSSRHRRHVHAHARDRALGRAESATSAGGHAACRDTDDRILIEVDGDLASLETVCGGLRSSAKTPRRIDPRSGMMNAPARNRCPLNAKSSSAARILTSAFLNRKVMSCCRSCARRSAPDRSPRYRLAPWRPR